ncbi:hypothetical protein [Dethiosulfatarculus sandiegensis]|uniref:Uncharacterized protein n=1 Tax=Dethiosulfatarculus sandiegensis TaxID=1429043 RepID=A0A0D2JGM0_9BACT|nr:hypothetical protein [Dethiosulfatarculus sandiegensis]KIX14886.1 hypothetical protein X474_06990 [Dethiosulfatarculus sandiegensis]
MAVTFGNMAKISAQSSMAIGNAQASSMGLGQQSANALAITDLMGGKDDQKGMIGTLLSSGTENRMKGDAFKNDLMAIGQAAVVTGPGRGVGLSASSSMLGSNINKVV